MLYREGMRAPQFSTAMVLVLAGVVSANVAAAEPKRGDRRITRGAWFQKLDSGLQRTIDWYVANRPWWEKQLWMREIPIITKTGRRELH